ncbi:MAG: YoaK family protein [Trebonia sp.]
MTQTGRRETLVVLLTAAAGATNVLSLAALGGVPASIMTANLVLIGLSTTHHEGALGWHAGAALAGFVVAVFLTSGLIRAYDKKAGDAKRSMWPRPVTVAIAAEALPLIGVAVGWGLTAGRPAGATQLTLCTAAAFAMGIQSAAIRALGVAGLSSTFFTGTLTETVGALTRPGPLRWSAGASGLVALVAGAAAEGAVLTYGQQRLGPLLPLVLVCCVAALSLRGFSREG